MQSSPVPDAAAEVEYIKGIVKKYFTVYETNLSHDSVSFKCQVNPVLLEENFGKLRQELSRNEYIPIITYRGGEHTITVGKLPKRNPKGIWINFVMMSLTLATTIFAGMILWSGYSGEESAPLLSLETIGMGALTFGVPILLILGIHEMGHYFMAKKSGVSASLPFFIPAPPPIGTFGAFISIREPIPDRKTLFNLGIAGPIAGFLVAIPIAILGIMLTSQGAQPVPAESGGSMYITLPLVYDIIGLFLPIPQDYLLHPTAMAGWVGFLVTAINLIPAGSLDGGHIARAILGHNARYLSWASVILLFLIGIVFSAGWMLFALIVLFLGLEHSPPLNDITPLSVKKKVLGALMGVVLVTSFVYVPMGYVTPDYSFDASIEGSNEANISYEFNHTFRIEILSTGNLNTAIVFDLQPSNVKNEIGFELSYYDNSTGKNLSSPSNEAFVSVGENLTTYVNIYQKAPSQQNISIDAFIVLYAKNDSNFGRSLPIHLELLSGSHNISVSPESAYIGQNDTRQFVITIISQYQFSTTLQLTAISPSGWSAWMYTDDLANASNRLVIEIDPISNVSINVVVESPSNAQIGEEVSITIEIRLEGTNEIDEIYLELTVV